MPITEISAVLNRRNSSGDMTVIYPITKVDNIDGTLPITSGGTGASDAETACANLGAAPAITYGTTDILAGSTSEKADGAMHFVYVIKNGVWDHVKSIFITIDGVWKLVWDVTYPITTNLTGVTGVSSNTTTISDEGTVELTFTPNAGYILPNEITVIGAAYTWDPKSGLLGLSNPTGNVSVVITGVASDDYIITFLGDEGDFTVKATNVEWDGTVEYSTNETTWTTWDGSAISSSNKKLYMRGIGNTTFCTSNGMRLVLSAKAGCYGNLNALLEYRNPPSELTTNKCYQNMFRDCANLTHAPELPATTLSDRCYEYMFSGCTNLTAAPDLPAMTLGSNCYHYMFRDCTSLTYTPYALPATTLDGHCYNGIFYNCTSLTQAPELPAMTLVNSCYRNMFYGCTSLTTAPELPATTLDLQCYANMFYGCTGLTKAPDLPATTLTRYCYDGMFSGCTGIRLAEYNDDNYRTPYRIPTSGTGTTETTSLRDMFTNTGGTFTGTPTINTTYYGAWGA